jgi:4-amino-4-deoxy-L-arabinose transferase-like glycosyltransferase
MHQTGPSVIKNDASATRAGSRRRWFRVGFGAVLLVAAGLRLWNLTENEYGNFYYAAAVRSMAASWHNFFYATFDPAGFLMLDKPPVAFWVQVLSVKLLGYNGLALHLPQVLAGVACVALVYFLTRWVCGDWAALVAALVMATTPAAVAVDRSNLPDTLLLLLLVLAAAVVLRGAESGRWWGLLLGAALVGLAFNTKMIVALILVLTLYLVHLAADWRGWRTRVKQLAVATVLLAAVSLSWFLAVDLTPPAARPYVGDTTNNSALSLAFGVFGFGRALGPPPPHGDHHGPPPPGHDHQAPVAGPVSLTAQGGRPGPLRLANRDLAGHISWLLPFALVGCCVLLSESRRHSSQASLRLTVLLWAGWLLSYAAAFSFSRSPVHPYYLALLGPPVAFFTGATTLALQRMCQRSWRGIVLAGTAVVLTALWEVYVLRFVPAWRAWLAPAVIAGACLPLLVLAVHSVWRCGCVHPTVAKAAVLCGAGALLICPVAWSLTPVLAPGARMVPIADPMLLAQRPPAQAETENRDAIAALVTYLRAEASSQRYLLAAPDIHFLAPLIIETGAPVMAYGGFSGSDPILSADRFADLVRSNQVRFVALPKRGPLGLLFPGDRSTVETWVRAHSRRVPHSRWTAEDAFAGVLPQPPAPWGPVGQIVQHTFRTPAFELYDCQP